MMAFSGPSTRVILSNFTFYLKKKKACGCGESARVQVEESF